jgi:NAD(P)-dependent dehydrogenase (short-subunit alcohol dehydrogenase family)
MSGGWRARGRVALVTGSNRGIGLALVKGLLARGAGKVYATARKPEALAELVREHGGRVQALRLDVTDPADVRQVASEAQDVDLLVNNAGFVGHVFGSFEDPVWLEVAGQEYQTNVLGTLRLSQAFAPILARQVGGMIVNIISIAGLVGMPPVMTYSTTKAAMHSLTQTTRQLLRSQGTQVVGVYPGPVDTDMAARITLPKVTAASAAQAILDGLEQGVEDIYTDPLAVEYGGIYAINPKGLEARVAAMMAAD